MNKHSPGPWLASCDMPRAVNPMALVTTPNGSRSIDCTGSGENYAQDCANANLIAAATALYEILQNIVIDMDSGWLANHSTAAEKNYELLLRHARDAIARAEGKP